MRYSSFDRARVGKVSLALGEGITGRVAASREPIAVEDVTKDDRCAAMVRRTVGQWDQCAGTPEFAGTVSRGRRCYRVFACAAHVEHLDDLRRMTDDDRAQLAHRREQWQRAKRGLPFERVQPIP